VDNKIFSYFMMFAVVFLFLVGGQQGLAAQEASAARPSKKTGDDSRSSAAVKRFETWLQQAGVAGSNSTEKSAEDEGRKSGIDSAQMVREKAVRDKAFNSVVKQVLPMSPNQIRSMRKLLDNSQRAAAEMPGVPPKPVSSTLQVFLAPGSQPPAIRMSQGFITSAVFVDNAGAPWPVESYVIGNPKGFNIQWDRTSNILMIQPLVAYSYANLAVRLVGLPTPVMLTLVPGQREVDYRVDLRVEGFGPKSAGAGRGSAPPSNDNATLMGVLDGIGPSGSTKMQVAGGDGQAWLVGKKLYLRTSLTLLSPGWLWAMHSPDGTHAYLLSATPSILVSKFGEPVELKIKGHDEI
jgi:intracellular multiplication protein IcmK